MERGASGGERSGREGSGGEGVVGRGGRRGAYIVLCMFTESMDTSFVKVLLKQSLR